ncbi:AraC family transcriptional regulator [Archangium violaceum]|uniref:AraC family transcriptional regulator n=1 Tax=Archangium violaceum TaxID=83451 RepID=UPI0037BFB2F0
MTEPTCWARGLAHVVEYATQRGADRSAILARASVLPELLGEPDARVPISAYYAGVEAAAEALADPYFGLHYIEAIEPAAIDAVGFLGMASRTVGEAVRRIIRYHRVMSEGEVFEVEVDGGCAVFRFTPHGPFRPAHVHIAQMYAADCLLLPARFTGAPVKVLSLRFAHPAHGDPGEYHRRFGRMPEFGAGVNQWAVPEEVLERPLPRPDAGLAAFLERYLDARATALPATNSVREQVRQALAEGLVDGQASLAATARRLRVSARTLQRRLASEGATWETLLTEVRRARARVLLEQGLPVAEVSFLLGYAEPAVFHRAFKRWTGMTPHAWRARAIETGAQERPGGNTGVAKDTRATSRM